MAIVYDTSRSPVEGSKFPHISHAHPTYFVWLNLINPIRLVFCYGFHPMFIKRMTTQKAFADGPFTPVPVQ